MGCVFGLMERQAPCATFLARALKFEELHILNRGHWNGLSNCRLDCHFGSTVGRGLH